MSVFFKLIDNGDLEKNRVSEKGVLKKLAKLAKFRNHEIVTFLHNTILKYFLTIT